MYSQVPYHTHTATECIHMYHITLTQLVNVLTGTVSLTQLMNVLTHAASENSSECIHTLTHLVKILVNVFTGAIPHSHS